MSKELLDVLQPIFLALIAASIPGLISWLAVRRKTQADSSQVIVDAAANATKTLIEPLTKRVGGLEAEVNTLRSERDKLRKRMETLEHDHGELLDKYEKLERENEQLTTDNASLQQKNAELTYRLDELTSKMDVRQALLNRLDNTGQS